MTIVSKPVLDIAVGLVYQDGLFLIAKRKPEAHLGSFWEFPGGKVLPDETPEDAVVRELAEEVDLHVVVDRLFHREVAEYPERVVHLSFFLCHSEEPKTKAKPLAASELVWVSIDGLANYEFPKGNQKLLARLFELNANGGLRP